MTPNVPTGLGPWRAAAFRAVAAACIAALILAACGSSDRTDDSGVRKIAYLRSVATPDSPVDEALIDELLQRGFVEDENLAILGGSGTEVYPDPAKATEAVKEWEEEGVDVIVAFSTSGAEIARDHAPGAKVLFLANDPQAAGFVKDERRPEGRMTGVTFRIPADRMLSLARRIIPGLRRIGLAYPPADPAAIPSRDQFARAAQDQGLELISEEFTDAADLPRAVGKLVQEGGVQLLLASVSPTATRAIPQLAESATGYRIPFAANVATAEQALLTLSPDSASVGSQLGRQAARLLNGASPASVPVEDPRRFRIGLSQKVAQELGIQLPADVVREADVVRN